MKKSMENLLALISDTESIMHDDELARLIQIEVDSELSEVELEMVSAARKERFEKFKMFLENRGIK